MATATAPLMGEGAESEAELNLTLSPELERVLEATPEGPGYGRRVAEELGRVTRSAAAARRQHDEEEVARLTGTESVCGVCCTDYGTPARKVAHLAKDRVEAIAELGGPVGVRARNAAARIVARESIEELARLERRAADAGWPSDVDAWVDGYRRNRKSPAILVPGPARMAFAAGWIARQLDGRRLAHEANLDGQHDELDDRRECGACTAVGEGELRAIWGDR